MARTPKPWFWAERQAYFVTVRGDRHNLAPDKAEADRRFHELLGRKPAAAPPPPAPAAVTVAEVFEKYLGWCQRHRAPRTYEWSRNHIQSFCDHLGDAPTRAAADLKPYHVGEWVDAKPAWGANHRRGAIVAVTRPFNWAAKVGHIPASPVRGVEKPVPEKRDSRMAPADFERLIGLVKDAPFRDLLRFAYESGVRPQEARHLEARHLRLDQGRADLPPAEAKGKRRWRAIYLSAAAGAILARLAAAHPAGKLFRNTDGTPWQAQAIVCRFQRLLVKLAGDDGLPPVPRFDRRRHAPEALAAARAAHRRAVLARRKALADRARAGGARFAMYDIRHCFATRKLKEGHDPVTVAALLGHKDATMLFKHYEQLSSDADHLRAAVNGTSGA